MYIAYVDDSKENGQHVYSALVVKVENWNSAFEKIKNIRKSLKDKYGIYQKNELHASEFVGGRGNIPNKILNKTERCVIYKEVLEAVSDISEMMLFNSIWSDEYHSFSALMNRINKTVDAKFLVICDEGNERKITKLLRRMRVYNPISSRYNGWADTGEQTKNIPLDKLIEDPIFKDSRSSYFIQLVDFCAYSILRKEVENVQKNKFRLNEAFLALEPIFVKKACGYDPYGIIRKKMQDLQ